MFRWTSYLLVIFLVFFSVSLSSAQQCTHLFRDTFGGLDRGKKIVGSFVDIDEDQTTMELLVSSANYMEFFEQAPDYEEYLQKFKVSRIDVSQFAFWPNGCIGYRQVWDHVLEGYVNVPYHFDCWDSKRYASIEFGEVPLGSEFSVEIDSNFLFVSTKRKEIIKDLDFESNNDPIISLEDTYFNREDPSLNLLDRPYANERKVKIYEILPPGSDPRYQLVQVIEEPDYEVSLEEAASSYPFHPFWDQGEDTGCGEWQQLRGRSIKLYDIDPQNDDGEELLVARFGRAFRTIADLNNPSEFSCDGVQLPAINVYKKIDGQYVFNREISPSEFVAAGNIQYDLRSFGWSLEKSYDTSGIEPETDPDSGEVFYDQVPGNVLFSTIPLLSIGVETAPGYKRIGGALIKKTYANGIEDSEIVSYEGEYQGSHLGSSEVEFAGIVPRLILDGEDRVFITGAPKPFTGFDPEIHESFEGFYPPGADAGNIQLIDETGSSQMYTFGDMPEDNFGSSILVLGDLNNDGFNDFLVGAPGNGRDRTGDVEECTIENPCKNYARVVNGIDGYTLYNFFSETDGTGFGSDAASLDQDFDGIPDFIVVSAPEAGYIDYYDFRSCRNSLEATAPLWIQEFEDSVVQHTLEESDVDPNVVTNSFLDAIGIILNAFTTVCEASLGRVEDLLHRLLGDLGDHLPITLFNCNPFTIPFNPADVMRTYAENLMENFGPGVNMRQFLQLEMSGNLSWLSDTLAFLADHFSDAVPCGSFIDDRDFSGYAECMAEERGLAPALNEFDSSAQNDQELDLESVRRMSHSLGYFLENRLLIPTHLGLSKDIGKEIQELSNSLIPQENLIVNSAVAYLQNVQQGKVSKKKLKRKRKVLRRLKKNGKLSKKKKKRLRKKIRAFRSEYKGSQSLESSSSMEYQNSLDNYYGTVVSLRSRVDDVSSAYFSRIANGWMFALN